MATPYNMDEDKENANHNAAEGLMSPISSSEPHSSIIQETRRPYDCEFCFEYLEYRAATNHHCDLSNFCEIDSLVLSPSASVSGSVIECDLRSEIDETSRCMTPYDERSDISPDELVMEAIAALNKHILGRPVIATELAPILASADNTNEVAGDARPSTECHLLDQQELSVQITEGINSIAENGSDLTTVGNSDENNSMRLSDESLSQTFPVANMLRNFQCDICQRSFGDKNNLRRHMIIHSNKQPYECRVCSKRFSQKQSLDCHLRIHSGEKPYRCEVCSKAFSRKQNLVTHLRNHTGEKPYGCEVCSKRFSQKQSLNCHLRIHSGEKPYRCEVCSKAFSRKQELVRHLRTHSGEKPYRCEVCSKAFSLKHNLVIHLRTHSGEKPYRCEVCSKSFSDKSNWNSHIKKLHTISTKSTKKQPPSQH